MCSYCSCVGQGHSRNPREDSRSQYNNSRVPSSNVLFSLRSLDFIRRDLEIHKTAHPPIQERGPPHAFKQSLQGGQSFPLALRSLIVGPSTRLPPRTRLQYSAAKDRPQAYRKLITNLKETPSTLYMYVQRIQRQRRCSPLFQVDIAIGRGRDSGVQPTYFSVPVDKIAALFYEMHIIDSVNAPDFVGSRATRRGPRNTLYFQQRRLSLKGVKRKRLGYSTRKAVMPDHSCASFICIMYFDWLFRNIPAYEQQDVSKSTWSNLTKANTSVNSCLDGLELLPSPSFSYLGVCDLHNDVAF